MTKLTQNKKLRNRLRKLDREISKLKNNFLIYYNIDAHYNFKITILDRERCIVRNTLKYLPTNPKAKYFKEGENDKG